MIHSKAIVEQGAILSDGVSIGPFSYIGSEVKIDKDCKIHSNVVINGDVKIGEKTEIFPFSSIGSVPQDLKYKGEKTKVVIGKKCKIREYVTINLGTSGGGGVTKVGDNCLLMIGTHVAHDCLIGNSVIFANHSTLAGHVIINDYVVVGALSAIHQFTRIGESAMIGGMSGVTADVIPFGTVMGNRAKLSGLNIIGLKRSNYKKSEISELRKVYNYIFLEKNNTFKSRLDEIINKNYNYSTIKKLIKFLSQKSDRAYCLP